jgi:hypothetical protein
MNVSITVQFIDDKLARFRAVKADLLEQLRAAVWLNGDQKQALEPIVSEPFDKLIGELEAWRAKELTR